MAKIERHSGNLTPFAKIAALGERNVFGGLTPSDTLDDNLNSAYEEGWADVTDPALWPKLRDFNAAMFTVGQLIAYIIQRGIPEYHADQEYFIGSMCSFESNIHVSLTDANTNNLLTDPLHWRPFIAENSITEFEMADNSVANPSIKDNSVSLSKIDHGSPFKLFALDSSGKPVHIDKTWFGEGQTLVDKIGVRDAGSIYVNETTKPIQVLVEKHSSLQEFFYIQDQPFGIGVDAPGTDRTSVAFMIPVGFSYKISPTIVSRWFEITSDLTT